MKNNLEIYNKLREVPTEAQKKISGGRLNGMTDIKPMWRIEKLTEVFGPCGFGWKAPIKNKEIIEGANGEKIAIVDIDLYVKVDGEWSEPITGTGGSSFIAKEKNGLYTSDECFKMAYTDAISVACKSLGMGANVYWGDSKYSNSTNEPTKEDAEKYVFTFGKHDGEQLTEVIETDKNYINWIIQKSKDEYLLKCIELLTGVVKPSEDELKEQCDLLVRFQSLLIQTNTDKEKLYEHYGVKNNTQMTNEQFRDAIAIMEQKL